MSGAFHFCRHFYPFRLKTDLFELGFKNFADLADARQILGRAFDIDDLFEQRNRLARVFIDVVNDLLLIGRKRLSQTECRGKKNHRCGCEKSFHKFIH